MSVIGRLDDQVEAVLINPLKRRERLNDGEAERESPPLPPPAATTSHEERDAASSPDEREADAALPVWLL